MAAEGGLASDVKKFEQTLNKIKRMAERFGTKADSKENRTQLERERQTAKALAHKIQADLRIAPKADVRRHGTPFQKSLKEFQHVTESIDEREKALVKKVEASMSNRNTSPLADAADAAANADARPAAVSDGGDGGAQAQAQAQAQQSVDPNTIQFLEYDLDELEQRRVEVAALEKDVREVAEMFRDVAQMVNEQQDGLDTMEKNIKSAKDSAEQGNAEIKKAEEYQDAARRKQCIILFILLAVAAVIIVPIVVTQKK